MSVWIHDHQALLWGLTASGAIIFVATLIAIPLLIARLPVDYFVRPQARVSRARRPAVRLFLVIVKNAFGLVLLLAGLAMLVLPGQGLLAMLAGILMLDFPGKRRLERWLIRRRPILRAANWIRSRRHRPPLEPPGTGGEGGR